MCGIAGMVATEGGVEPSLVERMRDVLSHRGPDNAGLFTDPSGTCCLGHRRLSILDLSPRGHQPMSTPDGRFTLTFNGEVYNYVEIARELEGRGVRFETGTDTEVVLRAFETWGPEALQRCVGMFALAIWDQERQSLFVARDRAGKKPLVYFWDGETFAFASELKALLVVPGCEPKLDPEAVDAYFSLGYVPAPLGMFAQTRKLPPGHYLELHEGRLETHRYWFPERSALRPGADRTARVKEFHELFEDAVRIRLRSDVPIGLFLSGGIDSSAVAAECVRQGQRLRAFTVAFDENQTDLPYAVEVARHLGIEQDVIHTSGSDVVHDLDRIVWYYDEPFADTSNVPSYYIARATHGSFKVVLNGDGGDETFGGYSHYEHVGRKQVMKRLAAVAGAADGGFDPLQVYFQSKALFRRAERETLVPAAAKTPDAFTRLIGSDPFLQSSRPPDALRRAMWADRHIYLANDLLYKMDIALMAYSIEGRSPLLDHRLIEWAQGLPPQDLVAGRSKKILLREAYRGVLPDSVLDRPKHGFGAPVAGWLRGPLAEVLQEHLPSPLLRKEEQGKVLAALERGASGAGMRAWTLLMFAVWARRWAATW